MPDQDAARHPTANPPLPHLGRSPRGRRQETCGTDAGSAAPCTSRPRPPPPLHVTMRAVRGLPSLRTHRIFRAVRGALAISSAAYLRVVHFTVQTNHLHMLVEADGTFALSRGMQGLGIRLAKAINRRIGRAGRVWSDRYHCRALRTPREVRNGLIYVLLNGRKHHVTGRGIDPCSSGAWFGGWRHRVDAPRNPAPVRQPTTWLLRVGWRRSGQIGINDAPAGRDRVSKPPDLHRADTQIDTAITPRRER